MIFLDISCLGSCYKNSQPRELFFSLMSLFLDESVPKQVILVVDGPIDDDLKKIIVYFVKNFKIEVLEFNKNRGLGVALSEGLKKCRFNLVARFDTDDINLPYRLEKQMKFLKKKQNISVVGSSVLELKKTLHSFLVRNKRVPITNRGIILSSFYRNPINHPSVLFKKSDILRIGNYKNRLLFEDYDLWLRLINKGYKFKNFNEPLVLMRRDDASIRRDDFNYIKKEFAFIKRLEIKIEKRILLFFVFAFKSLLKIILSAKIINFVPWRANWEPMSEKYKKLLDLLDVKYLNYLRKSNYR